MISPKVIAKSDRFTICEIEQNGTSTLKHFFKKKLSAEQTANIGSVLQRIAKNGPPDNESRFGPEGDGIYAIKDGQVRIYCFYDDDSQIILTNGVIKKRQKADPNALRRAKKLRKAYQGRRS